MFWNKDLNKLIAEQTNLYSVQKDGKIIATTEDEIKQFIGIQMLNSHVDLSSYMIYWARETRYIALIYVKGMHGWSTNNLACLNLFIK